MGLTIPTTQADELLKHAQSLMAKKDEIESTLRELEEGLRMQGVGMDQPLIDAAGFPRSDVDIVAVRTSRNMVYRLRNDHKDIMKEIEQALHALHEAKRQENAAMESSEPSQPSPQPPRPQLPFAKVNAVAPDSPADASGLRRGDCIIKFGHVHADNHERLQAVNQLVARSEGVAIPVVVLRDGNDTLTLSLTPRSGWGGRGTLGCHIVPYTP